MLWGIRRPAGAIIAGLTGAIFPSILSGGFHWPSFVPTFLAWNGTKSVWLPSLLFGLGAIQMAQNPDGILAVMAEDSFKRRQERAERKAIRPGRHPNRSPPLGRRRTGRRRPAAPATVPVHPWRDAAAPDAPCRRSPNGRPATDRPAGPQPVPNRCSRSRG